MAKRMNLISQFKEVTGSTWKFVRKRWGYVLLLVVVLAIAAFWRQRQIQANRQELTTEQPTRGELVKTLELSGAVDAKEKARLRFLAGGKVVYLGAQEGDWVSKWQTIATIDRRTLQKQLEQDLNLFMQERLDWDQTLDDTYEDGQLTQREDRNKQKEQLSLTNEVLDVEIRDIAIRETVLAAPFEGLLTVSPIDVAGVQLTSADYFEIVNPDTLIFRATVDEEDVSQLRIGQEAHLVLDAFPDNEVPTTIEYISYSSLESSSGTVYLVEFGLPTPEGSMGDYRLGMNGDANVVIEVKQNALSVPIEATREREEGVYVDIKVDDHEKAEQLVETGLETDDRMEILSGLDENDQVVIPE